MAVEFTEAGIELAFDLGLGLITLCDSENGNRLYAEKLKALKKAFLTCEAKAECRHVLLRSADGPTKPWCFGMDLERLGNSLNGSASDATRSEGVALYAEVLSLMTNLSKTVIGCIGGPVMAGGVGLAAACDIILATESASFELSEIYYGLIPANVIPLLLERRLSAQRIKYLFLSAKKIDASEALAFGLVDECFIDAEADGQLKKLLKNLFRAEPEAIKKGKSFMNSLEGQKLNEALVLSQKMILELMVSEPVEHALSSLKKGESPRWFAKFRSADSLFWRA